MPNYRKIAYGHKRLPSGFQGRKQGFTLVEMLVSMVILGLMIALISVIGSSTNQVYTSANRRIEQFSGARNAFEAITRALGQATLNTYYDYYDAGGNRRTNANAGSFLPASYGRASDLEFVSGGIKATGLPSANLTTTTPATSPVTAPSQITQAVFFPAPISYTVTPASFGVLDNLLCMTGFYIQYSKNPFKPNFFAAGSSTAITYRFRLMQVLPPTENFSIYSTTNNAWIPPMWTLAPNYSWLHQVATNIVALIISPEDPSPPPKNFVGQPPTYIAPNFDYDSQVNSTISPVTGITTTAATSRGLTFAQIPPILHVVMVAIDEQSATKLQNGPNPPDFGLAALFQDPTKLSADLIQFQANLNATATNTSANKIPLNSRVFETRIALRESKWSSN